MQAVLEKLYELWSVNTTAHDPAYTDDNTFIIFGGEFGGKKEFCTGVTKGTLKPCCCTQ